MENEEVKAYLIKFAEKTLNKCELFTKIYGKTFVRERLEKILDKVITDIHSNSIAGCYNGKDKSITIFFTGKNGKKLNVQDIKNSWELQQIILHEAIHAIFNKTVEECKILEIDSGSGLEEVYHNGEILARGLNEGLTEWICEKAGYPARAYKSEINIIKMLELAIGEENVMKLAKGNIKGNVAELLGMSKYQCVSVLANIDDIYLKEEKINSIKRIVEILKITQNPKELGDYYDIYIELMDGLVLDKNEKENDINIQLEYLDRILDDEKKRFDKMIIYAEERIFLKYFEEEIIKLQNAEVINKKELKKITKLYHTIGGNGKELKPEIANSVLVLKFKNEIYGQLAAKYKPTIIEKIKGNLSEIKTKVWFQKSMKKNNDKILLDDKRKCFKEKISNMSNYSEELKNESMTIMKHIEEEKEL